MQLFDDKPFGQIPGQMALGTDPAPEAPARLTTREKRERKAERLRTWAEGRDGKADAAYAASRAITDRIPFGQPILVGHHSERGHRRDLSRAHSAMDQMLEHGSKASDMRSRADNIEAQNRAAIFSDDPDAVDRLREKLARLEAERVEIKRLNAAARKGTLTDAEKLTLARANQHAPIPGSHGGFPSFHLTNLSGNITRLRKRLEELEAPERGRRMTSRYPGECRKCGADIDRGDTITYYKRSKSVECESCAS